MKDDNVGEIIARLRKQHGWSQRELAELVGVSPGAVGGWEAGTRNPLRSHRRALAKAFGVDPRVLGVDEQDEADNGADDLEDALRAGDWRAIALALAEAQREHALAARIRAEADKLAQENIRLALEREREDASARVQGHSEAAAVHAGD